MYHVKISVQGDWKYILIDDYFPCFPMDKPIFAKSLEKDLWVLILEKAYAKNFGGYSKLEDGDCRHSLVDFTGCPVFSYHLNDPDIIQSINQGHFWESLLNWKK